MNFSNILNIKQAMTKVLKKKCWLVFFVFYFNLFQGLQGQVYHHITDAGAWCWFSDPRAIYLHGKETSVLTGWVKEDGSIEAARINLKTKEIQKQILFNKISQNLNFEHLNNLNKGNESKFSLMTPRILGSVVLP